MAHNQVQIEARRRGDGATLVTWVENVSDLKPGVTIDLKGEDGLWVVSEVFSQKLNRNVISRHWNVGGL